MSNEALRKHIGKHLQLARKAAGYKSAKAFAEEMGLAPTAYTEYEQGRHMFTIEQAWDFAEALGVDIDALVGHEVPQSFADPAQEALNGYWESMNDDGRARLLGIAELAADSGKVRVQKKAEAAGVPPEVEGVA